MPESVNLENGEQGEQHTHPILGLNFSYYYLRGRASTCRCQLAKSLIDQARMKVVEMPAQREVSPSPSPAETTRDIHPWDTRSDFINSSRVCLLAHKVYGVGFLVLSASRSPDIFWYSTEVVIL